MDIFPNQKISLVTLVLLVFGFNTSFAQTHTPDNQLMTIFLALKGRLPNQNELDSLPKLDKHEAKRHYLENVLKQKEFYMFVEAKLREDILEGSSSTYVYELARDYFFLYSTRTGSIQQSQDSAYFESLNYLGKISMGFFEPADVQVYDIYRHIFLTPIYDNINMGSLNYVVSVFQHLLGRKPTTAELTSSMRMIEGYNSSVFQNEGSSKFEFITHILNNPECKEQLIRYWYLHLFNEEIALDDLIDILHKTAKTPEQIIQQLALKLWEE